MHATNTDIRYLVDDLAVAQLQPFFLGCISPKEHAHDVLAVRLLLASGGEIVAEFAREV